MTQKPNQSQSKNPNERSIAFFIEGILPPQVDEDVTFGIMWIRVGKLKLTRGKGPLDNKVIIQFWGQKQPVFLQNKSNPLNINQSTTMIQYDIKCPVTYFKEYLMDMKKNLRLQVQDVGKVDFDITKFLKQNVDLSSRYVFDHFKGAFEILGQHNRKIGTIELQMACNFNPQLTALQLGEEDQSQNLNDHEHQQRKIAEQKPELFKQFYEDHVQSIKKEVKKTEYKDDRIPNSLCTEMSAQKFNPALYLKEQPQIDTKKSEQKVLSPSPRGANIVITKASEKQRKLTQENEPQKAQQAYNFPTITKVLTYSNLRLTKGLQQEEQDSKMKAINQGDREKVKIQKREYYEYQPRKEDNGQQKISANKILQEKSSIQQKYTTQKQYNRPQTPVHAISKQDEIEISDRKQSNPQSQSNLLDEDKEILSRVVNLDQELKKSQVNSPAKQKMKEFQQDLPIKMKPQKTNHISQKQNEIKPITQYNHPDLSYEKQFKESPKMKYPLTQALPSAMKKIKPSSLILNLLVEIETNSIKFFKKKEKFNLIHRPYGCKERIKLGPKFQTDKITIMCPMSEQLVTKMDKLPFIVEFWGAVTNQFLGFIKIDLSQIKRGFMLQGRLNEIAVKSNLMPIIIQKGEISIQNVNGERSGECCIYAGIGTSAQIALYLNTERRTVARQPSFQQPQIMKKQRKTDKKKGQKQQKEQNQIESKLDLSSAHTLLTNFLYFIDMNSNKNIQQLAQLMRKKEVTNQEFQDFILQINSNQQKIKELIHVFKHNEPFVKQQQKFIKTSSLKASFDRYKEIQQSLVKQFNMVSKFIQKRLSTQMKDEISKSSSFNIIQKQKFKDIYINNLKSRQLQKFDEEKEVFQLYYLSFFEQFVNVKTIFSQEKLNSLYEPNQQLVIVEVINEFIQVLLKKNISLQYLQIYLKETDGKQSLDKKLERFFKQHLSDHVEKISLWQWVCLCYTQFIESDSVVEKFISKLKELQQKIQKISVIQQKIASEQAQQLQRKAFQQQNKEKSPPIQPKKSPKSVVNQQKNPQQINKNQSIGSITDSNLHNILNQKQTSNLIKDLNHINNQSDQINKQQYSNVLIEKQNIDVSNSQLTYQQKDKQHKYFEHLFQIKGVQLFLQHPVDGEYLLTYRFPYEEQSIGSKKIRILPNKHRYAISLYGQHKISIEGDIREYLNEIPVKFQLVRIQDNEKQSIELEGDLHCDQLLMQQDEDNDQKKRFERRVVLLFGQDVQKVEGKVKLQLHYESKQSSNQIVGKQTVYNLFLPKVGFVNFGFELKLQQQKIKSQFQLDANEEYYVSMTIDMFNENKQLKPYYPPIVSPLYSDLNEEITFTSSLKLTLNPNILSYIKENSCHVSLNLIYYSKSKGNYEKKQTTFATLKIPLFNLIQSQGISGNYAFKNKYGMFVALCKSNIYYDKYQKKSQLSQSNANLSMTGNLSHKTKPYTYWVMIHFKQLINFEQNVQTTFVKFETIMNAQKYQTQKIHLTEDPLLIFNDLIVIPLNEEQFFRTKIVPISILFDQNQKFAMDISMRPILRKLSKQNYSINGGYFLVVDQDSQMTKMRVGARVVVFKGSSMLQPFINAYANNINVDVLKEIDFKRDIENYHKLLDVFKNELKLSKKTFEQCLRQILVNKNEKLPLQLMSSQLLYKLELTPIVAENQDEVDSMARNINGISGERKLIQFVQENDYKLMNFHQEILTQFSFQNLWTQRIDKNVEYFNLKNQIDVLTLARKIKVIQGSNAENGNQEERKYKQLRITIEKGVNFHYLYNGIKPNVLIKFPQLSYESKLKPRSSEPDFNQTLREIVDQQNQMVYRNLRVEVYHVSTGRKGEEQEILIGEGKLNVFSSFNLSNPKSQCEQKSTRVIISSTMSSKMKATLSVKLKLSFLGQSELKNISQQNQVDLQDASRIQEMIKDINKQMDDKRYMFEQSSDEDY